MLNQLNVDEILIKSKKFTKPKPTHYVLYDLDADQLIIATAYYTYLVAVAISQAGESRYRIISEL